MLDREKIVEAIENCIGQPKCRDCPWEDCEYEHEIINSVPYSLMRDALKLLKEQEQIVRCKDCRRQHDKHDYECPYHTSGDPYIDDDPPDDFFCAIGERKVDPDD